jgi:dTDP-4-amino-4,6-dideoxygalactose transaminase
MTRDSTTPVRSEFLPFYRPAIGEQEVAAVAEVLRSGWLTYGPKVREFGAACARYLDVPCAVPVASCSAGLFLALRALGIGPGDEVVLPALTFASTLTAVLHCGAQPVLADIENQTLGLDPEAFVAAISERTRAVLPVHLAGHPCRLRPILQSAASRGVKVVEDAAHAFGAAIEGRRLGDFGDATVFSFYATKCITTGDGGLITTRDQQLAEELELLSYHGMDAGAWQRYSDRGRWYYEVVRVGYKLHLGDPAAALGLVQLERADAFQARRASIARRYNAALDGLPGVALPIEQPWATHAWHLYILRIDSERIAQGRDGVIEDLASARIGSSVHFIPLHHHPAFREVLASSAAELPVTERYYSEAVSLPLFPAMTDGDVQDVIAAVTRSIQRRAR